MLLFNVQRFSTHDGPGIRTTVFFKGCPLRCRWCHNPESQSYNKEVSHNPQRCVLCGRCAMGCPKGAIEIKNGAVVTDRDKCTGCGTCADECLNCAREVEGKEYSADRIMDIVKRDKTFYGESGGGVTFSGGECLAYPKELTELLKACRRAGIHTAVDTSGYCSRESLAETLPYTDLYMYDVKCMASEKHREYTGAGNELILENLRFLKENGANIWLRLPLIEGVNCGEEDISAAVSLAEEILPQRVSLLPYHNIGNFKYEKLGRTAEEFTAPRLERLEEIKRLFEEKGHEVKIGG